MFEKVLIIGNLSSVRMAMWGLKKEPGHRRGGHDGWSTSGPLTRCEPRGEVGKLGSSPLSSRGPGWLSRGIWEPGEAMNSSSGHFLYPVRGRPSPGHADPADDSHHEQDLGPGGAGHAHGHLPLLLHGPGQRSAGSGGVAHGQLAWRAPLALLLPSSPSPSVLLQENKTGKVVAVEAMGGH